MESEQQLIEKPVTEPAPSPTRQRDAFWDLLRGFALLLMMTQHFFYDLRYLFQQPLGAFLEQPWFIRFGQPFIVFLFVFVSGYVVRYQRRPQNALKRLLPAALAVSGVTFLARGWTGGAWIPFNVLHVLLVGHLLNWLIRFDGADDNKLALRCYLIALFAIVPRFFQTTRFAFRWYLWIAGFTVVPQPPVLDFLPLCPWLALFALAMVFGLIQKHKNSPPILANCPRPLAWLSFLGRHSLAVYLLHQPLMLGLLALLRLLGLLA